jgi:hypothetical protein
MSEESVPTQPGAPVPAEALVAGWPCRATPNRSAVTLRQRRSPHNDKRRTQSGMADVSGQKHYYPAFLFPASCSIIRRYFFEEVRHHGGFLRLQPNRIVSLIDFRNGLPLASGTKRGGLAVRHAAGHQPVHPRYHRGAFSSNSSMTCRSCRGAWHRCHQRLRGPPLLIGSHLAPTRSSPSAWSATCRNMAPRRFANGTRIFPR